MAADGTTTTGKDGILAILEEADIAGDDPTAGEITAALENACMTDWTMTATAQFQEQNVQCMKSNDDGGSDVVAGWNQQELTGKSFTLDFTNFWQKADAGASGKLDATKVGQRVYFALYPNNKATGDPRYHGWARLASVSPTASTSTKVTQTGQLIGDGDLEKEAVPA